MAPILKQHEQTKLKVEPCCLWPQITEYKLYDHFLAARDMTQILILTEYKLNDYQLAVGKGRYKKTGQPIEECICGHCLVGEAETEMHFLL